MATLAHKLGIEPGHAILLLDPTLATAELLRAECPLAEFFPEHRPGKRFDAAFFWPSTLDGLTTRFATLQRRIIPAGAVWAVIPKKPVAKRLGLALTWEEVQAAGLRTDLVDNKIVSLSADEYATRFVIRTNRRASFERTYEP
jgi:hypothetical protein